MCVTVLAKVDWRQERFTSQAIREPQRWMPLAGCWVKARTGPDVSASRSYDTRPVLAPRQCVCVCKERLEAASSLKAAAIAACCLCASHGHKKLAGLMYVLLAWSLTCVGERYDWNRVRERDGPFTRLEEFNGHWGSSVVPLPFEAREPRYCVIEIKLTVSVTSSRRWTGDQALR